MNIIHDKIISALSNMYFVWWRCLAQFWAPARIDGRLLLSNSGQPFAVTDLHKDLVEYRVDSEKYKYNIDVKNKLHIEGDPMIRSGGPATTFLNRLPYTINPLEDNDDERRKFSLMLPICFPSESSCVGVFELTMFHMLFDFGDFVLNVIEVIKKLGLDVCNVQEHIPYKTINGLRAAKDEIEHALQIVCGSHNLNLAQVWIGVKDKSRVPLSSYLEDTQRVFGLKLTGCLLIKSEYEYEEYETFEMYNKLCDLMSRTCTETHALKTLQDFKSRYICMLNDDVLLGNEDDGSIYSSLVICLRSNDTGDFDYAFEFIWRKHSNYAILLEALLLTLKRCLPSFKFASGAELGDELDVIVVQSSGFSEDDETDEIEKLKIFQGKRSSPMAKELEEGKKTKTVGYIASSQGKYKTATISLPREVIEKQFGKTMKEAAKSLNVSLSTLKRKCNILGISEWRGPNLAKRKANDLHIIQTDTNEKDRDGGAIKDPSTVNMNKNTLTIKAEYGDDIFKFHLPILQATLMQWRKKLV